MSNQRKSSHKEASLASKTLQSASASDREKKLAASVLSQARPKAETSKEMADYAARVLENPKASETAQSLAGSVLSQTPHKK